MSERLKQSIGSNEDGWKEVEAMPRIMPKYMREDAPVKPEDNNYQQKNMEKTEDYMSIGDEDEDKPKLSEKDQAHLEHLQEMVKEMRRNAESLNSSDSESKKEVELVRQANLERAREQVRDLVPKWIEDGNKYIPEGRQAEWAEHVANLVEVDPSGARERVERVLSLMQRLGDDRINLADLRDRASDRQIQDIARDFRRFEMTSPLAGTDLGSVRYQKIDEDGNLVFDENGEMELEDEPYFIKANLSVDDKGVLEDLLLTSPQGLRLYQEIWPERFWDEHDRAYVEEAKKRNAIDVNEARKKAVESGELEDMIRARQKRQGGIAMAEWGGTNLARKRVAALRAKQLSKRGFSEDEIKQALSNEVEPDDYWEQIFMDAPGAESDDIESAIEVLNILNKPRARIEDAIVALDDYDLDESHRDFVRNEIVLLHPRGVEFYLRSNQNKLSENERSFLNEVLDLNEKVEPGIRDRLWSKKTSDKSSGEKRKVATTPEERAEKNAKRNEKIASEERIRIESETRKLQAAKEKLAEAEQKLAEFKFADRFNKNRMRYKAALDDLERAKKAVATAENNIAGGKEVLARALRGEM